MCRVSRRSERKQCACNGVCEVERITRTSSTNQPGVQVLLFFPILASTTCTNPMRGSRNAQLRITTLGVSSQPKATTSPFPLLSLISLA